MFHAARQTGVEVLWTTTLSCASAQCLKPFSSAVAGKGFNWKLVIKSGGMPSSHSAGVTALATAMGLLSPGDSLPPGGVWIAGCCCARGGSEVHTCPLWPLDVAVGSAELTQFSFANGQWATVMQGVRRAVGKQAEVLNTLVVPNLSRPAAAGKARSTPPGAAAAAADGLQPSPSAIGVQLAASPVKVELEFLTNSVHGSSNGNAPPGTASDGASSGSVVQAEGAIVGGASSAGAFGSSGWQSNGNSNGRARSSPSPSAGGLAAAAATGGEPGGGERWPHQRELAPIGAELAKAPREIELAFMANRSGDSTAASAPSPDPASPLASTTLPQARGEPLGASAGASPLEVSKQQQPQQQQEGQEGRGGGPLEESSAAAKSPFFRRGPDLKRSADFWEAAHGEPSMQEGEVEAQELGSFEGWRHIPLKESVGHTKTEVLVGALTGVAFALALDKLGIFVPQ
eukprot:jgi/Mesen1/1509/ME000132S00461